MPTANSELSDAELHAYLELLDGRLYSFRPRPDRPQLYDQQTSFLNSKAKVSVLEGGNGSGKTESAAQKAARFMLLKQAPPWRDSTFLVVSDTFSQVGNICWKEKLKEIIPAWAIDDIRYQDSKLEFPLVVRLKPWPKQPHKNWVIEFRSLEQGRRVFQGRRYAGFWFSEQFEWPVFEEVLRGCRETWYDGAHFAEFTPIDPDLCLAVEEKQQQKLEDPDSMRDWAFFRLNTELNTSERMKPGWAQSFLKGVSTALYETRRTGAHPTFAGAIYPEFNPAVHVLDDDRWEAVTGTRLPYFPDGVYHRRGMDFGESVSHPFVCLWGFRDGGGRWFIYDEYVEDTGLVLYPDRIEAVRSRWRWPNNSRYGVTYADPSRPLIISQFNSEGVPTIGARNDVDDGIETIRKLMDVEPLTGEPALYIHRKCKRLVSELRRYQWVKSTADDALLKGRRLPLNPMAPRREPLKYKDDTCDALRYLIHSDTMGKAANVPSGFSSRDFDLSPKRFGIQVGER